MHLDYTRKLAATVAAKINTSSGPDACHPISGRSNGKGYVQVMVAGKRWSAHRYVYERVVGTIPLKWEVDHLCHNVDPTCDGVANQCEHRRCCNPRHLEAKPHRANVLDGKGLAAQYLASTTCSHGHPRTAELTFVDARGARRCRLCYWIESPVCRRGHAMSGDNVIIARNGYHYCRTCRRHNWAVIQSRYS